MTLGMNGYLHVAMRTMKRSTGRESTMTTRTQTLAMIASSLNRADDETYYRDLLNEVCVTPERDGLILAMADGTQFKITLEEII